MTQIVYILLFYFLGEVISHFTGNIVPGSVIGMVLLFGALQCKVIYPEQVEEVSTFLTSRMVLFFLPPGVGIMCIPLSTLADNWIFIVSASVISTLLVATIVAFIFERFGKEKNEQNK